MSQPAKNILPFPGQGEAPKREQREVRVADLDNGYTRIANEILEAVMLSGLTQNQMLVVMAVMRKTYGYNKTMDWISNDQMAELTGLPATRCSTIKNQLVRLNVLSTKGREVGLNKVISEWETAINGFCKTFTDSVNKTFTKSVKKPLQKPLTTKDTKDNKDKTPLTPLAGGRVDEAASSELTTAPEQQAEPKVERATAQQVVDAYNEILGSKLPTCKVMNAKRKRDIKKFLDSLKAPTLKATQAYLHRFAKLARPFHLGDNDRGWKANFDYVIRENTVTNVREETL